MNVFAATSRGRDMADYFNSGYRNVFSWKKSATLEELGTIATQIIDDHPHLYQDVSHLHPNIVYIIGGLPDTTHFITDKQI